MPVSGPEVPVPVSQPEQPPDVEFEGGESSKILDLGGLEGKDAVDAINLRKWSNIDKKASFKLKLLYRATRDGDEAEKFWRKCDNQGNTFTLVKSK